MTTIKIDPLTRIEGHLKIETEIDPAQNKVARAQSCGLMFRGVEVLLKGRDPMDAHHITQRICGVCPIAHGIASVTAQEDAYVYKDPRSKKEIQGVPPTHNGMLLRNLIFASNFIQSHVLHFYHLAALDYVDITAILKYAGNDPKLHAVKAWAESELKGNKINPVAPFLPRYEGDYIKDLDTNVGAIAHYLQALDMRALAHEMLAIFGAKMPHVTTFIPTGVTANAAIQRILRFKSRLDTLIEFIDNVYVPDVVAVAGAYPQYFKIGKGPDNFLCYGAFRETEAGDSFVKPGVVIGWEPNVQRFDHKLVTEDVGQSYFSSASGRHPWDGETVPAPRKSGAYSWIKAPRYDNKVMQVGPLSRMVVQYMLKSIPGLNETVDSVLSKLGIDIFQLNSVMGRHAARAIECKFVAHQALKWLDQLKPGEAASRDFDIPDESQGFGGTEAPRGALGHWIKIKNHRIDNYQCVVPTTWNCSPRDDRGRPGAVEQALEGTVVADPKNPIELGRIVRSFDPCLACSVH